jgi:hypothetical protein
MQSLPSVQVNYFALKGGLNLVTPPLAIPDGMVRESLNFEVDIDGGYRRVAGYERFDGRPQPSDAVYRVIPCTFNASVSTGNTITGAVSGATGVVIAVGADFIAFTKAVGTFGSSEAIQVGGVTKATSTDFSI